MVVQARGSARGIMGGVGWIGPSGPTGPTGPQGPVGALSSIVWGPDAPGVVPTESPVLTGGLDGTDVRTLLTDTSGRQQIVGAAAAGAVVAGNPVLVAGQDGTDARTILTDATGQVKVLVENSVAVTGTFYQTTQPVSGTFWQATQPVSGTVTAVGDAASGAPVAGNPVLAAGSDGTDARTLLTDATGQLKTLVENTVPVTGSFYQATQPVSGTFWQATQPVSGTFYQATQPVSVAAPVGAFFPNNAIHASQAQTVSATVTTISTTATQNAMCVVVGISCAAGKTMAFPVAVRIRDTTNGITTAWQISPIQIASGSSTQLYFNLPVTSGDTVDIDLMAQGAVGAGSTNVVAVLSAVPIPVNLRPDGRSLPMASQSVEGNPNLSVVTIVAGVAGWRCLIGSAVMLQFNSSQSEFVISGTQNGAACHFCIGIQETSGPGYGLTNIPASGILMDAGTAVTASSGGPSDAQITYDLVPQ